MSNSKRTICLSEAEIREIQRQARAKLGECKKTQEIVGQQVFSILGLYARALYYPLGKTGPWGITYINNSQNVVHLDKPFVAVNTSIPIDAQVFAAAHELYHIWYDKKQEMLFPSILDETDEQGKQKNISELKADRFAAEFLVDEDLLFSEMKLYSLKPGKITLKDILMLTHLFTVPYKAMVKRLWETKAINQKERNDYLSINEKTIDQWRKRYSIPIPETNERIALDNLVELAGAVYEKKLITYEKLEYLLYLNNLSPEDIGISKPQAYISPSDNEIDKILEE